MNSVNRDIAINLIQHIRQEGLDGGGVELFRLLHDFLVLDEDTPVIYTKDWAGDYRRQKELDDMIDEIVSK